MTRSTPTVPAAGDHRPTVGPVGYRTLRALVDEEDRSPTGRPPPARRFDDELVARSPRRLRSTTCAPSRLPRHRRPDLQRICASPGLAHPARTFRRGGTLISQLADIGGPIVAAIRSASLPILLALVLGQVPRWRRRFTPDRIADTGAAAAHDHFDLFINLAVPSTAAATSIRFFQRSGTRWCRVRRSPRLRVSLQITLLVASSLGLGTLGFGGESSFELDTSTVTSLRSGPVAALLVIASSPSL